MQGNPDMVILSAGGFLIHQERQTLFKSQVDALRGCFVAHAVRHGKGPAEQLVEKNGIGHE